MRRYGLLSPDGQLNHDLLASLIPDTRHMMGYVELYLPYYLLPLSQDTIMDMMNNRLAILDFFNVSQLVARLKDAGYEASISDRRNILGSLEIVTAIDESGATSGQFKFENIGLYLSEMINEFQSMESFINRLDVVRDAARLLPYGE